jgi:hypothetical protein
MERSKCVETSKLNVQKHLSNLVREIDALARKVLDDEMTILIQSLNPNSAPMKFDMAAAISSSGNGWIPEDLSSLEEDELRERQFGSA